MKRFQNILVYADGSEAGQPAVQRALTLAQQNQGQVTLCGVLDDIGKAPAPLARLQALAKAELERRLLRLAAPLRRKKIPVAIKVETGPAFLVLIRDVLRSRRDLLLLVAEGSAGRAPLFGGTTMHLLRKCPCPVWVLKPGCTGPFRRIVAAVDLVKDAPARVGLNTRIMELATSLAAADGATLHVVHAWQMPHEKTLRERSGLPKAQIQAMIEARRAEHKKQLAELLARFPLDTLPHQVHLLKWPAAVAIDHVARAHRADLIIMGTVGRTGLAGFFIGNTAEEVLRESRCAVLAVKPPGFVSPIQWPAAG